MMLGLFEGPDRQDADALSKELQEVVLNFHKDMSGDNDEVKLKALRALLPTRKDLEVLFPNHAEKLWAKMEPALKEMEKHLPELTKELSGGGEIKKVDTIDMRLETGRRGFNKLFEIIPKDIPVYETIVRRESRTSGGAAYTRVNGRWIFFRGLDSVPDLLEKLK
jgi:hypothetical protein